MSDAACLYRGRKGPQMDGCLDLYCLSPCGCPAAVEGVGEAKGVVAGEGWLYT